MMMEMITRDDKQQELILMNDDGELKHVLFHNDYIDHNEI